MTREQFNGYYFAFDATGDPKIDAILKAVATAASVAHHTQDWEEFGYIERIQDAAAQAALCVPAPEAPEHSIEEMEDAVLLLQNANGEKADRIAALEAALRECADDLAAEINARYNAPNVHPAMLLKYERDIAVVENARRALSSIPEKPALCVCGHLPSDHGIFTLGGEYGCEGAYGTGCDCKEFRPAVTKEETQ